MARMTAEQRREDEIIHEMARCVHFMGIQHDICKAGVDIRKLVGGPTLGIALRMPCLLMHAASCTVVCDSRKLPTREEAEAEVDRSDAHLRQTLLARSNAKAHAKAAGLKQGNGGRGSMPCAVCGGTLHYSVASVNGHMHCATEGCVSWME